MNNLLVTVAALLALFAASLSLAQQPQGLSELMSGEQMTRMGLHKLTAEEQQQLFQWITGADKAASSPPPSAGAAAVAASDADDGAPTGSAAPVTAAVAAPAVASASAPKTATTDANFGKSEPRPDQMRTVIPGRFTGWDGDTTFTLDNGQVWQQRYRTTWRTDMTDPEVVITRHLFGLHRMEVVGTGQTVPVKRVR